MVAVGKAGAGKKQYGSGYNTSKNKTKSGRNSKYTAPRLNKDEKPVSKELKNIDFKKITAMNVETGWLDTVDFKEDGKLELTNSWEELVLLLLDMVYSKYKNNFMAILSDNNVISDGIYVGLDVIDHPATATESYVTYKLNNSPYYVEFLRDGEAVLKALYGLFVISGIDYKTVKFTIKPLVVDEATGITMYRGVKQVNTTKTLSEIIEKGRLEIEAKSIAIFGNEQKVNSTKQAMLIMFKWMEVTYSPESLKQALIRNTNVEIGLTTSAKIDDYGVGTGFETERICGMWLYFTESASSILKYMFNVAYECGLSPDLIEITYKELQLEK